MTVYQTWLLCSIILLSNLSYAFAQLPTTLASTPSQASPEPTQGGNNGIISDPGSPSQQASISFSIQSAPGSPTTTTSSSSSTGASDSSKSSGLGLPATLGIALAAALVFLAILATLVWGYTRRRRQMASIRRITILDAEFAQSQPSLAYNNEKPLPKVEIEKPLPTLEKVSEERLSRSSTIIAADAAEVAQINRKASLHQKKARGFREKARDRNKALEILVSGEDRRASMAEALSSHPTTPASPTTPTTPKSPCYDNNGDVFQHRPSKI